jgi:hypothetical protein
MELDDKYIEKNEDITRDGIMGNYVQGNEPGHHIPYLYNWTGKEYKTQERVRIIMEKMYGPKQDGLCGNDDAGQMSAWYIFSALGFYPVVPGSPNYALGSPLVEEAILNLDNGNSVKIIVKNQSKKNVYVKSVSVDGNKLDRNYLTHDEITKSKEIVFEMSSKPKKYAGSWKTEVYLFKNMINLKTKVNPNKFEKDLGKLLKIYKSTISSLTFVVLIYSLLILIVGIFKSVQLISTFNNEFFIWIGVTFLMFFILIYFPLAIRYSYVATFENGILIKKRYKTRIVKNKEIKKIELRNLSIFYNQFRSYNSKRLAIDIFLNNNNIISIGESYRIFELIAYPRIPSFTKIWDIKVLYKELENIVYKN